MKKRILSGILAMVMVLSVGLTAMAADGEQITMNPFDNYIFKVLEDITESDIQAQYDILFGFKAGGNNFVEINEDCGFEINFKSLNEPTSSEYFMAGYNGSDLYPNVHIKGFSETGYGYMAVWTETTPIQLAKIYRIRRTWAIEDGLPEEAYVPVLTPATPAPVAPVYEDGPKVSLNGTEIVFDQIPVIIDGRTLVPVRAILEALGATVGWDGDTQTVTSVKGDIKIKLTIGESVLFKNNEQIPLDVPAMIINERTLIPLRAVAEAFDVVVDFDAVNYSVNIITN